MKTEENCFKEPEPVPERRKVYLPGQPLNSDEELVCDPSAYIMLHEANSGMPRYQLPISIYHLQEHYVKKDKFHYR